MVSEREWEDLRAANYKTRSSRVGYSRLTWQATRRDSDPTLRLNQVNRPVKRVLTRIAKKVKPSSHASTKKAAIRAFIAIGHSMFSMGGSLGYAIPNHWDGFASEFRAILDHMEVEEKQGVRKALDAWGRKLSKWGSHEVEELCAELDQEDESDEEEDDEEDDDQEEDEEEDEEEEEDE